MQNLELKHLLTIRAQGGRINSTLQKPGIPAYNLVTEEREPQAVTITILSRGLTRTRGKVYFNRNDEYNTSFSRNIFCIRPPPVRNYIRIHTYIHT